MDRATDRRRRSARLNVGSEFVRLATRLVLLRMLVGSSSHSPVTALTRWLALSGRREDAHHDQQQPSDRPESRSEQLDSPRVASKARSRVTPIEVVLEVGPAR